MRRFHALQELQRMVTDELVVTNLGLTADEWWTLRPSAGNLYTMGMGLVTPVGLGLALAVPDRRVVVLDGDGSLLFNLGSLATVAGVSPANLLVVVVDNQRYASTGDHPTATAGRTDLAEVARGAGLEAVWTVDDREAFAEAARSGLRDDRPGVVVARVEPGDEPVERKQLSGQENKYAFVRHVEALTGRRILRPLATSPPAGDPPVTAPPADLAEAVLSGLRAAGIDFVAMVPATQLSGVQEACRLEEGLEAVTVTNEGEGAALCAGAWLGGRPAALLMETSGLLAAAYALVRCHRTFGIPTLLVMTHRGQIGERHWYAAQTGAVLDPLLAALGIPSAVVEDMEEVPRAIGGARDLMNASLNSCAVLIGAGLTLPGAG